ncbi:MAG: hypothetical protein ACTSRI_13220 [Promethearchaeota archaeon]
MEKNSTIRVSLTNLKILRRIAASITIEMNQKTSLNDALSFILTEYLKDFKEISTEDKKIQDRQKFISLLQQSIEGAGPEDYNELEFDV